MARPPSFSVEEFQALISLTLDLKERCHEGQGHSRMSSPNLISGSEYVLYEERCDSEGVGGDDRSTYNGDYPIQNRTRSWTESQSEVQDSAQLWARQAEARISRVGCECDCSCGCGYVGKYLGSSGRCERCERKCPRRSRSSRTPAIDVDDDQKRGLALPNPSCSPALPYSTPPPRRRRFSLSTSTALGLGSSTPRTPSPSPSTSHAVNNGLLSKVNRAFRRISLSSSSPSTPVSSRRTKEKNRTFTAPTTPISAVQHKRTHRRTSSNAFSTRSAHTPTLTPTKEERYSLQKNEQGEQEVEGREEEHSLGVLKKGVDFESRLRPEDIGKDSKSGRAQQSHSQQQPHHQHQHHQQQHQLKHHNQHQHQHEEQHPRDPIHSPSSSQSFDSIPSTPNREYSPISPTTFTEPSTPSTFESCAVFYSEAHIEFRSDESSVYHLNEQNYTTDSNINFHPDRDAREEVMTMLAIAPIGSEGMLTPSMEDVVGCMGSSSGDEGIGGVRREREKSRERGKKEMSKSKSRERSGKVNLNDTQVIQMPSDFNATASPTHTPTKLQFSFPLGMFSPSNNTTTPLSSSGTSTGDVSSSASTPNTPLSSSFGSGGLMPLHSSYTSASTSGGSESEDAGQRGRKLSMLGRLKKGLSIAGRGKGSNLGLAVGVGVGGGSPVSVPALYPMKGVYGESDVGVRSNSVLAREREELERDVDLRFVNSPSSPMPSSGHGHAEEEGGGRVGRMVWGDDQEWNGSSEEIASAARRGVGEGGLPSVCVTFATSSASGSGSGCASSSVEEGKESGSSGSTGGIGSSRRRRKKKRRNGTKNGTCASSLDATTITGEFSVDSTPIPTSAKTPVLSPRASMGTLSSPSNYSCSSYVGSVSSFFAADAIERERRSGNVSSSSGGGNLSTSSGGKKSMDGASFLSLDLSGSEGSASDDTSRGGGGFKGRGKKDIDGASFIEFGEDVDADREQERRKRGIGMASTPPRRDHRGKKRASVVLFKGTSDTNPSNGERSHGRVEGCKTHNDATRSDKAHDAVLYKAPSVTSRSDISIFSGSTSFEFAPVVDTAGPSKSNAKMIHHASSSSPHHHRQSQRFMEPSITVYDVDGDSFVGSSMGGAPSVDAMSVSTRSADSFSVDAMSVNSDETDYIPFLPLVLQHERLQKTLRKPVSMEAVVSANEAGRGVARSVRSLASMTSGSQSRSSAVRLDPRSAHAIGSSSKVASRLGSEESLGGSSKAIGSKRLPLHVPSIAGVVIPTASNNSRAPSICSSVATEDSIPVLNGATLRASGITLRVQTDLDLDLGARRVVVCGSGLDVGVENLREGRVSISSEDGAGSFVVSDDSQSQRGTLVDPEDDNFDITPTPTPRATVFIVDSLEVTPSGNSTPSTRSSNKTFIAPPQPSIGSIRRTPSRQALKATPPRAPPSNPLPLPPLSPTTTSSSSSGSDRRVRLSPTASGSEAIPTRPTSDVNAVSLGASAQGERDVGIRSVNVEEGKKGRLRLSMQAPKDLWRARKKASAVGMGPEPRRGASSSNLDQSTRSTSHNALPTPKRKVGVVFPSSRSLSFSSPSSQKQHDKPRVGGEIDANAGGDVHQHQDHDLSDGEEADSASILRVKEGSYQSVHSLIQSDDEEHASRDDHDDESIDLDSDSMRQLLAANTSANAAMHSNLDVHKIGMGRQVMIPSPPSKKKSGSKLKQLERARTRSCLGVGIEWTLGLGESDAKAEEQIPARHASHSGLKKTVKPEPERETSSVVSKKPNRLSDAPSSILRTRTKSESALRALDSGSVRAKKTRSVLPDFDDWTLSLPLPSPRDYERSRKVSELGASIGLASVEEKSKEKHPAGHRHSTAPTASKRHTLEHKKRRASHHPIARVEDVDSGVDLEASKGDDEPSESDEDDLRTPPLSTQAGQAFVAPTVVSLVDTLDSERMKQGGSSLEGGEMQVLEVSSVNDMCVVEEELEEDTPATRARSNLAKLDALSADLKRFNDLLRSGHPGSGSRKSEVSVPSVSSHKGSNKSSTLSVAHPEPFSYATKLKHVRSCEPFESKEPVDNSQSPPKNALFRTSCANLRESVLSSLPASDNEEEEEEEVEDATSDLSISTLTHRRNSQSSMRRASQPRTSLSKPGTSPSPAVQSPSAAEEDINCSSIDIMNIASLPTGLTANAVFGPSKWGKSSSLGRSGVLPGQARTTARAPLPFAPPVGECTTVTSSPTIAPPNGTNERKPKKLRDGIADISPTLRNAVSSIELGRMVPIAIPVQPIPPKKTSHVGEQREGSILGVRRIASGKKLAVPPSLSVQISPMRRSSIILSDMTPTSSVSSAFPTPLASSFPIPPNTLPSIPLDFELGAIRMAQIVPPTPPAPLHDARSAKSQPGRPSTSSSTTSTINASVVQRMKERLESLSNNVAKPSPAPSTPVDAVEAEGDTDQSSLCSGAYYSARSSFSEERRGD